MSHSCSESNHNLSCKCCGICIFVFHQGQYREKLKLNRTWTLMFPKRCPNQFVVPSTSNHPHFQQQGHRAKNDKGWTEHQIIVLFNSACRSPEHFSCRSQPCAIFPLNAFCIPSDNGSAGSSMYTFLDISPKRKAFLMFSKSVCDNRLALLSLTHTRAQ